MKKWLSLGLISLYLTALIAGCSPASEEMVPDSDAAKSTDQSEWVIQWKGEVDLNFLKTVTVIHRSGTEGRTMLVRLKKGVDEEKWVLRWTLDENVEFLHPNHKYKVESRVSFGEDVQEDWYYLKQIGAKEAWRLDVPSKRSVTVAVVDTGVDLKHPTLKPYLIDGIDVRDPGQLPEDRMGHGTRVAGVIAAVWDGWKKTTGQQRSVQIMPIKVMETGQDGDVYFTAEGIREAIQRKVDVIVLAQGSWTYSETMADAVSQAEEEGVVVVGAAGNAKLDELGGIRYNSPLYYPAAMPTVLAVGSVGPDREREPTSNAGPGLDVVAPGESILAASLGGGHGRESGTSFAVPQVAALAAVILEMYPDFSPVEVRNLIRQTADPAESRWDEHVGFGHINVYAALTSKPKQDIFESNNSAERAIPLSLDHAIQTAIQDEQDQDWYSIATPGEGTLTLKIESKEQAKLMMQVIIEQDGSSAEYEIMGKREVNLSVPGGRVLLKLTAPSRKQPLAYELSNQFRIKADEYENNDYRWNAHKLKLSTGTLYLEGTLHKKRDVDWFRLEIPSPGKLNIQLDVSTPRTDPVLYIQEEGSAHGQKIDQGGAGDVESIQLQVSQGAIYVRVSDFGGNVIPEPYLFGIHYEPTSRDLSEPNDLSGQSTLLKPGQMVKGEIDGPADLDWYTFFIDEESQGTIQLDLLDHKSLKLILYDYELNAVGKLSKPSQQFLSQKLSPGRYYIRIQGDGGEGEYEVGLELDKENRSIKRGSRETYSE